MEGRTNSLGPYLQWGLILLSVTGNIPWSCCTNTVLRLDSQHWGVSKGGSHWLQAGRANHCLYVMGLSGSLCPQRGKWQPPSTNSDRHPNGFTLPVDTDLPLESQSSLHTFKALRVSNAGSRLGPAPNEIISNVATNIDRCRTGPVAHMYPISWNTS